MTVSFYKVSNQIFFGDNLDISLEKKTDTNQNRGDEMKTLGLLPSGNSPETLIMQLAVGVFETKLKG
jgi:hypothetical protein